MIDRAFCPFCGRETKDFMDNGEIYCPACKVLAMVSVVAVDYERRYNRDYPALDDDDRLWRLT